MDQNNETLQETGSEAAEVENLTSAEEIVTADAAVLEEGSAAEEITQEGADNSLEEEKNAEEPIPDEPTIPETTEEVGIAEAATMEAETTEPATIEVETAEPVTMEAETTEPATIEAETAEPVIMEAETVEPATMEEETADPATIETENSEDATINEATCVKPDEPTSSPNVKEMVAKINKQAGVTFSDDGPQSTCLGKEESEESEYIYGNEDDYSLQEKTVEQDIQSMLRLLDHASSDPELAMKLQDRLTEPSHLVFFAQVVAKSVQLYQFAMEESKDEVQDRVTNVGCSKFSGQLGVNSDEYDNVEAAQDEPVSAELGRAMIFSAHMQSGSTERLNAISDGSNDNESEETLPALPTHKLSG